MADMRESLDDTQLVFAIMAATDTTAPTEVVERITQLANKWRYEPIGITHDGTILCGNYDEDGQPVIVDPFGRPGVPIIDKNGLVPEPWSPELVSAIKATFQRYSIQDLLGGL